MHDLGWLQPTRPRPLQVGSRGQFLAVSCGTMMGLLTVTDIMLKKTSSARDKRSQVFKRARWKHFVRWGAFLVLIFIDLVLVYSGVKHHLLTVRELSASALLKEGLAYIMMFFCNLMVLPTMVFEVDSVEVTTEGLRFRNLLFAWRERWEDISSLIAPVYLRFAILKGRALYYLINKRDILDYDELVEIIRHKAPRLSGD
jgi:hypothetical protein